MRIDEGRVEEGRSIEVEEDARMEISRFQFFV